MSDTDVRILIVEDKPHWQKMIARCTFLKRLRQKDQSSVVIVSDYEEALKEINAHHFDIAITDFYIEGEHNEFPWRSLARSLQQNLIPIVVVSGYLTEDLLYEMINDYNVAGAFHKAHLDPKKLSERLEILLQKPKSQEAPTAPVAIQSDISVLHLSDLHCGPKYRFADRYSSGPFSADVPDLVASILADIENQGYSIDAIVVSGDLSHSAEIEQFSWARKLLTQLSEGLNLSQNQVVIVPGNHDVKWTKEQERVLPAHEPTSAYKNFYELFYKHPVKDKKRLFHTILIESKNLLVVGLDSCVIEDEKSAGIGYVGQGQLNTVLNEARELIQEHSDCVKIAVLHHHLLPVETITKLPTSGKNFSLVMDANSVLRRLYQENFTAVLHGHQHQPYCVDLRLYGQGISRTTPIIVTGAGSIGAKREDLGAIARNHYSVVQIQASGRNKTVRVIGRISSDQNVGEFQLYDEQTIVLS